MATPPRECRARIVAVRERAPEVLEAVLRMENPPELTFDAGQWVSVPFGPKLVRAYSIASAPAARREIALAADVAPAGIGSRWFRALAPGDEVHFKGPLGGFVLPPGETRQLLFVAEEIGIVPIRSILMDRGGAGLGPARLVYWARRASGLAYHEDFRALAARNPAFTYHPLAAAPEAGFAGALGTLEDIVDRLTPSVENLVAYVAGGAQVIHRVRELLMAKGLERKAVKWEKFW